MKEQVKLDNVNSKDIFQWVTAQIKDKLKIA